MEQQNAGGRHFTVRRRDLIALFGTSFVAFPLQSGAETAAARVAILRERPLTDPQVARGWQIFVETLAQSGWIEGRNIIFDDRATEGRTERYHELAAELVALTPTVIVTFNSEATEAVRARTKTIPILMIGPRVTLFAQGSLKALRDRVATSPAFPASLTTSMRRCSRSSRSCVRTPPESRSFGGPTTQSSGLASKISKLPRTILV